MKHSGQSKGHAQGPKAGKPRENRKDALVGATCKARPGLWDRSWDSAQRLTTGRKVRVPFEMQWEAS